jgi:hypothetical protein
MGEHKIKNRQRPPRPCRIKLEQLPQMADAILLGNPDPDRRGWVMMEVSPEARDVVNSMFPSCRIDWKPHLGNLLPRNWLEFEMNVPGAVKADKRNTLPDFHRRGGIDDCNQDQLAFLLACGLWSAGLRCAVQKEDGCIDLYARPPS